MRVRYASDAKCVPSFFSFPIDAELDFALIFIYPHFFRFAEGRESETIKQNERQHTNGFFVILIAIVSYK